MTPKQASTENLIRSTALEWSVILNFTNSVSKVVQNIQFVDKPLTRQYLILLSVASSLYVGNENRYIHTEKS